MQAVLYIAHGSRIQEACNQARSFINKCIQQISVPIQEICFLELASPSIEEGFARCIEQGATKIAVVPVLLLSAGHAKKDIPNKLKEMNNRFPHVEISYGRPFGVHHKIVDVIMERIREQQVAIHHDAMVLLVGRGSSDPQVKQDLGEIASLLQRRYPFKRIETCFLAAAEPSFEEGLELAKTYDHKQVFIIPYLLFTGVLMNQMKNTIRKLSNSNQQFILCTYLGYHPYLRDVVNERVQEQME